MALVTNDEPVYETPEQRRIVDAGTVLDDSNPIVLANREAFRPVGPADDEGVDRTSAVAANPELQHEDVKKDFAAAASGAEGTTQRHTSEPGDATGKSVSKIAETGKSSDTSGKSGK